MAKKKPAKPTEALQKLVEVHTRCSDLIYENAIDSEVFRWVREGMWIKWVEPPKTRTLLFGRVTNVLRLGGFLDVEQACPDGTSKKVTLNCTILRVIRKTTVLDMMAHVSKDTKRKKP